MPDRPIARRALLQHVGVGGALLAASHAAPAWAHDQAQQGTLISAATVAQLAEYAGLPLDAERAAILAPRLQGTLLAIRAMQPANYMDLAPATAFRPQAAR
jgi:hypothetical protein